MTQLTHLIMRLSLGKELALAVVLLRLIIQAVDKHNVDNVAVFVYKHLPAGWRQPQGPATETEFVDLVRAGQLLLEKIQAVLKPQ